MQKGRDLKGYYRPRFTTGTRIFVQDNRIPLVDLPE